MLGTIPLMLMNLANRLIPYPIAPDWIQAGLDRLWAPVRGSVHALLAGLGSGERAKVVLVESQEPGAWSLKVRGDLLQSGKLGAQKVPFGESPGNAKRPLSSCRWGCRIPLARSAKWPR